MFKQSLLTFTAMTILSAPAMAQMVLTSTDIQDGGTLPMAQVFNDFGCTGGNLSPQLSWEGAPEGTKSFAITAYDPDAPTGSGWWHWGVFNISALVNNLPQGASHTMMPHGAVQTITDYGSEGYGGACPPEGDTPHRYIFKLHALDVDTLPLDKNASGAKLGYFLGVHALETAEITVTYGR